MCNPKVEGSGWEWGDDGKNFLRVDAGLLALGGFDAVRLGRVLEVPILNLRVKKSDGTSVQ